MDKITIELNDKVLKVTEKAFNVIYKGQGYTQVSQNDLESEDECNIEFENLTVKELKELAKDKEIEGYSNMKKEELIEVLEGD